MQQLERELAAAEPSREQQAKIEMLGRADPVVPPSVEEAVHVVVGNPTGRWDGGNGSVGARTEAGHDAGTVLHVERRVPAGPGVRFAVAGVVRESRVEDLERAIIEDG